MKGATRWLSFLPLLFVLTGTALAQGKWTRGLPASGVYEGVVYQVYGDGSGSFRPNEIKCSGTDCWNFSWSVRCDVDSMNDTARCSGRGAGRSALTIVVYRSATGVVNTAVHLDPYAERLTPGSTQYIRIDDGRPLQVEAESSWSGEIGQEIIRGMRSGARIRIRYTEWPNSGYTDEEVDVRGTAVVLDYLHWWVENN